MSKFKILAVTVLALFVLDNVAYGGAYRREMGRDIRDVANHVGRLDWHGLGAA